MKATEIQDIPFQLTNEESNFLVRKLEKHIKKLHPSGYRKQFPEQFNFFVEILSKLKHKDSILLHARHLSTLDGYLQADVQFSKSDMACSILHKAKQSLFEWSNRSNRN